MIAAVYGIAFEMFMHQMQSVRFNLSRGCDLTENAFSLAIVVHSQTRTNTQQHTHLLSSFLSNVNYLIERDKVK